MPSTWFLNTIFQYKQPEPFEEMARSMATEIGNLLLCQKVIQWSSTDGACQKGRRAGLKIFYNQVRNNFTIKTHLESNRFF